MLYKIISKFKKTILNFFINLHNIYSKNKFPFNYNQIK